ncbi:MAG: hypothetical protein ACYDEN_13170 [Acidimicrobiales bacterium]
MHPKLWHEVQRRLQAQHGVMSRKQLSALGVDETHVRTRVSRGEWESVGRLLIRASGAPPTPVQALWVASLAAGPDAVLSHLSAAWLWKLLPSPGRPSVTVPVGATTRIAGVTVHRSRSMCERIVLRGGLPCTDPMRTLEDLAGVLAPSELDELIDRGLSARLLTVETLEAHVAATKARGRSGTAKLRAALGRRGFVSAPASSVLESRFLRLLAGARIHPVGVEVQAGPEGRYRIDTQLTATLFVEVDGYAYHHSPEQKANDERRRNRLRLDGNIVLVYTWRDVVGDGARVLNEIRRALATQRAAG